MTRTDRDAELAVAATEARIPGACDAAGLTLDDFATEDARVLWAAVERLKAAGAEPAPPTPEGEPTGLIVRAVSDLVASGDVARLGGVRWIARVDDAWEARFVAEDLAHRVRRLAAVRRAARLAAEAVEIAGGDAADDHEAEDALRSLPERVADALADRGEAESHTVADAVAEEIGALGRRIADPRRAQGVPTPWGRLDALTTGLHAGELWVLAGRPGHGKSVLGLQFADRAADEGRRVLFASIEMPDAMMRQRYIAMRARVPLSYVRTGRPPVGADPDELVERVHAVEAQCREHRLALRHMPGAAPRDVLAAARRMRSAWGGLDLVVVDYLQLLAADRARDNREQETAAKSAALKAMAGAVGCAVLALAQINREVERTGRKPRASDLRESGAIEQDADVIALIHRPNGKDRPPLDLLIDKQRNGPPGLVPMALSGSQVRAEERAPEGRGGLYA